MKPQDIVIALTIRLLPRETWNYPLLSNAVGLSMSQVHGSCARLKRVRLLRQDPGERWAISARNIMEFLVHGVRYAFAPKMGDMTSGIPTTHAAPFLGGIPSDTEPLVWPRLRGPVRGHRMDPMHPCAHHVIGQPDGDLIYQALVYVDFLRLDDAASHGIGKRGLDAIFAQR